MTLTSRGSLGWLGLVLAGLVLGGYVVVAWPDGEATPKAPATSSQAIRAPASVGVDPELEPGGVAGAVYPGVLYAYELGPTPFVDAVIAAPSPVDAE